MTDKFTESTHGNIHYRVNTEAVERFLRDENGYQ